jgi:hypothetical protein
MHEPVQGVDLPPWKKRLKSATMTLQMDKNSRKNPGKILEIWFSMPPAI